jgi:hypothetical protein
MQENPIPKISFSYCPREILNLKVEQKTVSPGDLNENGTDHSV